MTTVNIVNLVGVSFEFLRTAQAPFMSTLPTGRVVVDPVIIVLLMYSQCITILMIERKIYHDTRKDLLLLKVTSLLVSI